MGDRRNVVLDFGDSGQVVLYSHYGGSDLHVLVAHALDEDRERWDDDGYLARFLVTYLIDEDRVSAYPTGWGLYPGGVSIGTEHPDIVVDLVNQRVTILETYSFEEFVVRYKHGVKEN